MEKNNERLKALDNAKVMLLEAKKVIVETKIILPEISREELLERYNRIKPMIKRKSFYYKLDNFSEEELYSLSLISDIEKNRSGMVSPRDVDVLGTFPCYHTIGNMGEFSPKISEVLSQFPDELLKDANMFCFRDYPRTLEDFEIQSEIIKAGCHKSHVRALRVNNKK